jgi:SpoU rRNA methylase family enzyme
MITTNKFTQSLTDLQDYIQVIPKDKQFLEGMTHSLENQIKYQILNENLHESQKVFKTLNAQFTQNILPICKILITKTRQRQ